MYLAIGIFTTGVRLTFLILTSTTTSSLIRCLWWRRRASWHCGILFNEGSYQMLNIFSKHIVQIHGSFYQKLNIFSFIKNWLTCLTTFTISRHCLWIGFPSFVGGFHPTKLVSRKKRPIFCAISRETKFCTSLLVFHNRATIFSLSTNFDVVARVGNLILYNTLWGKNVNATQMSKREVERIFDQSFSLIWVSNI